MYQRWAIFGTQAMAIPRRFGLPRTSFLKNFFWGRRNYANKLITLSEIAVVSYDIPRTCIPGGNLRREFSVSFLPERFSAGRGCVDSLDGRLGDVKFVSGRI